MPGLASHPLAAWLLCGLAGLTGLSACEGGGGSVTSGVPDTTASVGDAAPDAVLDGADTGLVAPADRGAVPEPDAPLADAAPGDLGVVDGPVMAPDGQAPAPDCRDLDGDGYFAGPDCLGVQDCDDTSAGTNPGADDLCNLTDDDCDGALDEDGEACPPPCAPLMDCYDQCTAAGGGTDACWTDCSESAGNEACTICYDDMVDCGVAHQCIPGGEWDSECMATWCDGMYEACYGSSDGQGICSADYLPCLTECGDDYDCGTACYYGASFVCRSCIEDYSTCTAQWGCYDEAGEMDGDCVVEHCMEPYDRCFIGAAGPPACQDADGDGFGRFCEGPPDCDDSRPDVAPGAAEVCNGRDDDCDGRLDEKTVDCQVEREWAFLVYMAGDNDLTNSALFDLELMTAGGGTDDDVAVAVQIAVSGAESGFPNLPVEVYERTWRMVLPHSDTPDLPSLFENACSIGDVDVSQPESLSTFLDWAAMAVPARHYALVVWDHGGGWSGIAVDDGAGGGYSDFMSLSRLRAGLEQATVRPEVTAFVACEMGAVEVLHALLDRTDYMVGSEDVSGASTGLGAVVAALHAQPAMTARELPVAEAGLFAQANGASGMHVTWTALDMAFAAPLIDAVQTAGALLAQAMTPALHDRVEQTIAATQMMMIPETRDLADFAERLTGTGLPELDAALESVRAQIVGEPIDVGPQPGVGEPVGRQAGGVPIAPGLVIARHIAPATGSYGNRDLSHAHGLTVFLATPVQIRAERLDAYREIPFCQGETAGWDEFLAAYYEGLPLGRTEGDFRFDLSWAPRDAADAAAPLADVDLLVATPDGWVAPYFGTLPGYPVSPDSLVAGVPEEWFAAEADVAAGSYYVLAVYPETGLPGTPLEATVRFTDQRFADNDTVLSREMGLEAPCGFGAGVFSADILAGRCSNVWFVGKLVRDDRPHRLVQGLYDDFHRDTPPRW